MSKATLARGARHLARNTAALRAVVNAEPPKPKHGQTPPAGPAESMLRDAAGLVAGPRDRTHGSKLRNFENIAQLWNAYLFNEQECGRWELEPHNIADLMELMKVARRQHGAPNPDDYIDAAGYAACGYELAGHGGPPAPNPEEESDET